MAEPHYCEISRKFCACDVRCVDDDPAAFERATYCSCDKGDLTTQERATGKCQRCNKPF